MTDEIKKEKDGVLEDIEDSLAEAGNRYQPGYQSGYRMMIHPNGLIEITTGVLAGYPTSVNPHYSCCCCCG